MSVVVPGEASQDTGRDGLNQAKRWLELSTRVHQSWTHRDAALSELLGFKWPHGDKTFSFDLGGQFRGGDLENQSFLAEVKKYKNEGDLPTHFRDFVAKCYVALQSRPKRCDHFLWLSWAPFQAQKWDTHTSAERIANSLVHPANRTRVFGTDQEASARAAIDPTVLAGVSSRLWLVTLSDRQDQLVLTKDHYAEVIKLITAKAM